MNVTCPTSHINDALEELQGCGTTFDATPDGEGYVDCPSCGLWFRPKLVSVGDGVEAIKAVQAVHNRRFEQVCVETWADRLDESGLRAFTDAKPPTVPEDLASLSNEEMTALYGDVYSFLVEDGDRFTGEDWEAIDENEGFNFGINVALAAVKALGE